MSKNNNFIESALKQFHYYKLLGEKAMEQLTDDQLFISTNEETNSIAVIVQHLAGNMLSRWTDFLVTDGEKEWRNRDAEFEVVLNTREQVLELWNKGWHCLFQALEPLEANQLQEIIYIRSEGHTVMEAINRQLAHYPYHVGQIVFYAKLLKDKPWDSLSIPKNNSSSYNTSKFSLEKSTKHFTDDEIKKLR